MDNPFINPAVISYCPGVHGLDRGVKRAIGSIRTVAYLEIEAFLVQNILWGIEKGVLDEAPVWPNLKTFNAVPFRGKVHGVFGGYPCQGESTAGKRQLWKDPRFLYPYIEKHLDILRPFWGFFENVAGHLTGSFPYVLESLQNLGYVVEAGIFTAEEVGAPHKRARLFILAIRQDYVDYTHSSHSRSAISLANTYYYGPGNVTRHCYSQSQTIKGAEQREEWDKEERERLRIHPGHSGHRSIAERWPARRGEPQKSWEEPRAVESGLGCTVDGYSFREDLLRAYGNSVVEQTAELAFRTLYSKLLTPTQ